MPPSHDLRIASKKRVAALSRKNEPAETKQNKTKQSLSRNEQPGPDPTIESYNA
jgi:hypothetical protein